MTNYFLNLFIFFNLFFTFNITKTKDDIFTSISKFDTRFIKIFYNLFFNVEISNKNNTKKDKLSNVPSIFLIFYIPFIYIGTWLNYIILNYKNIFTLIFLNLYSLLTNKFNNLEFDFNNFRNNVFNINYIEFKHNYINVIHITFILSLVSLVKFGAVDYMLASPLQFNNLLFLFIYFNLFYLISKDLTIKFYFNTLIKLYYILYIIKLELGFSGNNNISKSQIKFNRNLNNIHTSAINNKDELFENIQLDINSDTESDSFTNQDSLYEHVISKVSVEKAKELKDFHKNYSKGIYGYSNINNFGSCGELLAFEGLTDKIKTYLNNLPENKTFSILPSLRYEQSNGEHSGLALMESFRVTKYTSPALISIKISQALQTKSLVYNLDTYNCNLLILSRPWLSEEDFKVSIFEINKILEQNIENELEDKYLNSDKFNLAVKDKSDKLKKYHYDNVIMDNYGEPIYNKESVLIGYRISPHECASLKIYYNADNKLCNEISIKEFDEKTLTFKGDVIISWLDIRTDKGFVREFKNIKYYYDKENKIYNVENSLSFNDFPLSSKDKTYNSKIGAIDFETFGSNLGLGHHQVYAGGWAVQNKTELFYVKPNETSEQLVNRIFLNILNNKNLNGYTFYAHNLGRFDSIFILKSLILVDNVKLTPIWKDNSILSIVIKFNENKIKLLDSALLIKGNLDNILKSFECSINKGKFPYSFVNSSNLNYNGKKPDQKYYKNVTDSEYLAIPDNNWNLKTETLNYLKSDIEGLLEVMSKFGKNIYDKYQLNITDYKTLPSLALSVYTSSYLPRNLENKIKMIKGELEKEIRTSYFGGNVDVYINKVTNGYYYDLNSQYPKAMLQDMPVGEPTLSLEKDLNKIFGFIYGEITVPDEQTLKVPFIQYKDPDTRLNTCPRGKFKRLIFSEEIKYALKYGYKINIEYCYQFEREQNLFKKYVEDHYEIKKNSKDLVQKSASKLFLNALYGRMGMRDIESVMKIVDKKEAARIDRESNVSLYSQLNDNKYIVRYKGKIAENVRKLYKKGSVDLIGNETIKYSKKAIRETGINKKAGVPSAVHIAAAIASYARVLINDYKNIPGNPCVMSDTDSVVLQYPLPSNLIGKELGQMKLEHKIAQGIFIRKKLYYILNSNGQEVIKSSGIDPSKLNKDSFLTLLRGESLEIETTRFRVGWKDLDLSIEKSKLVVKGLTERVKTTVNINNSNLKSISFLVPNSIVVYTKVKKAIMVLDVNHKETKIKKDKYPQHKYKGKFKFK